ncbi:MAG: hypothetical protein V3T21_04580 [Candidatus Margulisiibacteriota bacterium]
MRSRLLIFGIIVFFLLQGVAFARNGPPPKRPLTFIELWNNIAYYDTNLERKGFASFLGRFEGKAGISLFNSPLQVYGVYYGAFSQSDDYWNNSIFSGGGVRFKPFESYPASGWQDEWIRGLKIFAESLGSSYLKNAASAEAADLKTTDTRYGIEVWHEWNLDKIDENLPWGELWANLSVRSTNFSTMESNNYVLYFQPKIGKHLGKGVEVYLRADITSSDRDDYWLNIADYGVGVRFEPWRKNGGKNDLFRKFKMFAEILWVSYLKDKPTDPNKEVSTDVRLGIDFSFGR